MNANKNVKTTRLIISAMLAVTTLSTLGGCQAFRDMRDTDGDGTVTRVEAVSWYQSMIDDARSVSADFQDGVDTINVQIGVIAEYRNDYVTDADEYAEMTSALNILYRERDRVQGLLDASNAKMNDAQNILNNLPDDFTASSLDGQMIGEVAGIVTPFIPPPWNLILVGVVSMIPPLVKLRQTTNERNTVIASLDEGKRQHPELAAALDIASSTIRAWQGSKVAGKVDSIRADVIPTQPIHSPTSQST